MHSHASFYPIVKRLLDIVISVVMLLFFSPLFLLLALLIKFDSRGPVFYSHERSGKDGRVFRLLKLRSMVQNADAILNSNQELYEKYKQGSYKLHNDPRVTRVGKYLRRFSLDELPQFWNVLRGEMSIVGPRACKASELVEQQKVFPNSQKDVQAMLSVRPGLTGPWQVGGRNEIDFDERTRIGAEYAARKSLLHDLVIMIKTPFAALGGGGNWV